eukprot:477211_1
MQQTIQMLNEQEYDSDAIDQDINFNDNGENSNIRWTMKSVQYNIIKKYLYQSKLSEKTFSVGYRFYYWEYYRRKNEFNSTKMQNQNDHLGYKPFELFVEAKYDNLKDEIYGNNIKTLHSYQLKISIHKATKYFHSEKSRKIQSGVRGEEEYKYNIKRETPISVSHLLSICLYCDWNELCTAFSSTFRKIKPYEPISEVMARNREFANFSRILRETVEIFGCADFSLDGRIVKGPFYCGISHQMVLPEISMRLNGPTSTSKQIEVAQTFGGDDGMVIQLNNTNSGHGNEWLRSFGTAWISNYVSEDEWLFCGGKYTIRVESVIIQQTSDNFHSFFRSLFYFHSILNGTMPQQVWDMTEDDYLILNNLIEHAKRGDEFKHKYPKYIDSTFCAFINHVTQITLNLHWINTDYIKLKNLLLYSAKHESKNNDMNKNNVLRAGVMNIFPNIKRIEIYSEFMNKKYTFNLLCLLNEIHASSTFMKQDLKIIIKASENSWLSATFSSNIKTEFEKYGFNIELIKSKGNSTTTSKTSKIDCLIISKYNAPH